MTLTRRNQNWLPEMFDEFFDTPWMVKPNATAPSINVLENKDEYRIELAAPGMKKENFQITLNETGNLVITMDKQQTQTENAETPHNEYRYIQREFNYTKFQQTLLLPKDVKKEQIAAKMEDGILTVTLPKIKKEDTPKISQNIQIQ